MIPSRYGLADARDAGWQVCGPTVPVPWWAVSQYLAAMFSRRPNDGWFRVGRYDATTIDILCALAVATMFLYGINVDWWSRLIFFPDAVRDFEIWRIVTWPIATPPNLFALIGIAFFWSFGQQVEGLMGRGKFVTWIAAVTIVPAVVLSLTGGIFPGLNFIYSNERTVVLGLSTLFLCAIWLYAATYPNVRFFDVVPLWVVAGVFTMLNMLSFSGDRLGGMLLFFIIAIGTALSVGRSLGFATAWPIPHIPLSGGGGSGVSRPRRQRKSKPKSTGRGGGSSGGSGRRVVEGPWRGNDEPAAPSGPPLRPPPSPADQAELDGLLDKIGSQGMEALSGEEKQRLNELSKRLRNR